MDPRRVVGLEWTGEGLKFNGAGTHPETPSITIDGDGEAGPSPMIALLLAAAGCSAIDVVLILKKMRVQLSSLTVEVEGMRRDEDPRRYTSLTLRFRLSGDELDQSKAERAVGLSIDKYCSVIHTLAPEVVISHAVEIA